MRALKKERRIPWALCMCTALAAFSSVVRADLVINEVDSDTPTAPVNDAFEFVELYNTGPGAIDFAVTPHVLVLYNGSNDLSYRAVDLNSGTVAAFDYYVIGVAGVTNLDLAAWPANTLQNGQDAVALYTGSSAAFPNGTAVTTTNIVDAVVYDTADADDPALLALTPGQPQIDEDQGDAISADHSIQRCPDGSGGPLVTSTYGNGDPTPGAANNCNIGAVTGACILNMQSCVQVTSTDCALQGGVYGGDGSLCSSYGGCTVAGNCFLATSTECSNQGGTFAGGGSLCTGACCNSMTDVCEPNVAPANCMDEFEFFLGFNSTCAEGCPNAPAGVTLNEVRLDRPSNDTDYVEIAGPAGTDLTGVSVVVVGDGAGAAASGVVESVTSLTGSTIPMDGILLIADAATFDLAPGEVDVSVPNFAIENSDNITVFLVFGFSGAVDDDLDIDDDCAIDAGAPWASELDRVALIEEPNPPATTECHYGPPTVGPDGIFVPGHAYRFPNGNGTWRQGQFDPTVPQATDTPGTVNVVDIGACCDLENEMCTESNVFSCEMFGGVFRGPATSCATPDICGCDTIEDIKSTAAGGNFILCDVVVVETIDFDSTNITNDRTFTVQDQSGISMIGPGGATRGMTIVGDPVANPSLAALFSGGGGGACGCPGNFNDMGASAGRVDVADITGFAAALLVGTDLCADTNGDTMVNGLDIADMITLVLNETPCAAGLQEGDIVTIIGTSEVVANGLHLRIDSINDVDITGTGGAFNVPTINAGHIAMAAIDGENLESVRVRIDCVAFADGGNGNFAADTSYIIVDDFGMSIVRTSGDTPVVGTPIPAGVVRLEGVVGQFNNYQLRLHDSADILSASCGGAEGACCLNNGTCFQATFTVCQSETIGGTFNGAGIDCDPNPCIAATGACCVGEVCTPGVTQNNCATQGGDYLGDDSDCSAGCGGDPTQVVLNEIRIDMTGTDNFEFIELKGPVGTSLDALTVITIGDGMGGSGVVERVIPLTAQVIQPDGLFLIATGTFDNVGTPFPTAVVDLEAIPGTDLIENSDNLTFMLVQDYSGGNGADLDTNDDCVLDVMPWTAVIDSVASLEDENGVGVPPAATECHYGPPQVGPDGNFAPGHIYRCPLELGNPWLIGPFDTFTDTPDAENACPTGACCLMEDCQLMTEGSCTDAGGAFAGGGVPCDPDPCGDLGACCDSGSFQCANITEAQCTSNFPGRTWLAGMTCAEACSIEAIDVYECTTQSNCAGFNQYCFYIIDEVDVNGSNCNPNVIQPGFSMSIPCSGNNCPLGQQTFRWNDTLGNECIFRATLFPDPNSPACGGSPGGAQFNLVP